MESLGKAAARLPERQQLFGGNAQTTEIVADLAIDQQQIVLFDLGAFGFEQFVEYRDLDLRAGIVDYYDGHLAASCHLGTHRDDDAGEQQEFTLRFDLRQRFPDKRRQLGAVGVIGVAGKKEAKRLFFIEQALAFIPVSSLDMARWQHSATIEFVVK